MPNAQVLSEKQAIVTALTERIQNATSGVLVDYKGINVAQDTELRTTMRENEIEYTVVKNTLARFAVNNCGLNALDDVLNGTTALATTQGDPIIPLRLVRETADKINGNFAIKAAFVEGTVLDAAEVAELSQMSSKKDLQAQLVGAVVGPVIGLIGVLAAIIEKGEGAPAAE